MKIRIKFTKSGCMKFIGHLDVMRYFQKAMKRANVDICYSEGFSPHQKMSFASPLGVGLVSIGEYFDIEVNSTKPSREMIDDINMVMVEGITVTEYKLLPDNAKNGMSVVAAADYNIYFENSGIIDKDKINIFMQQESINVLKKTKKGESIVDIKPLIYDISVNENCLFIKIAQGSVNNLKPNLVIQALCEFINTDIDKYLFKIERAELYAHDLKTYEFVTLGNMGEDIEEKINC